MRQQSLFFGETYDAALDEERLTNNLQRIFALLRDGRWHYPKELEEVGGSEWSRRVRQLREGRFGGMDVQSERFIGGTWRYRLDLASIQPGMEERILKWDIPPKMTPAQHLTSQQKAIQKRLDEFDVSLLSSEQCEALRDYLDDLLQIELPLS